MSWITLEQTRKLLDELQEHQRDMVLFALAAGLRQGNVTGLCWSQVDLERRPAWIAGEDVKNGDDLHVSLNDPALEVLQRQRGNHPEWVFTYRRKPIKWLSTRSWRRALARAGIENFRWHDLRHAWANWLVQYGTPLFDLQEMGGLEVVRDGSAVCTLGARAVGTQRSGDRFPTARHNYVIVPFAGPTKKGLRNTVTP